MSDERPDDYSDAIAAVAERYSPRIFAKLAELRGALIDAGVRCDVEPYNMSADDYEWAFQTTPNGLADEASTDVRIAIPEAASYGDEPAYGISFSIDVTAWEGRILGGLQPYNYTSYCWIDATDDREVEARFKIIEDADPADLVQLVLDDHAYRTCRWCEHPTFDTRELLQRHINSWHPLAGSGKPGDPALHVHPEPSL